MTAPLSAGFANPPYDAQAAFRAVLSAMASPGSLHACPGVAGAPLSPVMASMALALLDYETPYRLIGAAASQAAKDYIAFHTGAAHAARAGNAAFAFALNGGFSLEDFSAGDAQYPERSVTIMIEAGIFGEGRAVDLSGPGINGQRHFSASNLTADFWRMAMGNAGLYPLGADFIFCGQTEVAALPRSTRIGFRA